MTDYKTSDSGTHQEYASGMKRDSQDGKPRFDLIRTKLQPYEEQMITRYARLLARGAEKYSARNWEDGVGEEELERAKASLLRHTEQLVAGQEDEDHAAAVWFNAQQIAYLRWRIAEKAKLNSITLHFDGSTTSDQMIELVTGGAITRVFGTAAVVPATVFTPAEEAEIEKASDEHVVKTSTEPDDGYYPDLADRDEVQNSPPWADEVQPFLEAIDKNVAELAEETATPPHFLTQGPAPWDLLGWTEGVLLPDPSEDPPPAFVDEGAIARKAHQDALNDWHNRPLSEPLAGLPTQDTASYWRGKHARTEPVVKEKTIDQLLAEEFDPDRFRTAAERLGQKVQELTRAAFDKYDFASPPESPLDRGC